MVVGLILATILLLLGVGSGYRQVSALKRVRGEPYMADEDRLYFRRQGNRRLVISGFLLIVGGMIFVYYLSGMDARMDAIPDRKKVAEQPLPGDPDSEARADKEFTPLMAIYWIVVIVILGVVVGLSMLDVLATRKYWMARYKELKADHETKLHRDLAVYRQQKLNERVKGLKKPDDGDATESSEGSG